MAAIATISGAQFDALPYEEGRRWELLEGEPIPAASPTLKHQEPVFRILTALKQYLQGRRGIASHDVEFAMAEAVRLRPDVWLVLEEKAGRFDWDQAPVMGSPDLAVEVISPSEYAAESMRKVETYLEHGVPEVWQVYPKTRQVVVYTAGGGVRKLGGEDAVTSATLPGFTARVSELVG